jgi:hypothetical protein
MPAALTPDEKKLERARGALLDASEALSDARNRAGRAKHLFVRASGAEGRRTARKDAEDALRELRIATLEYEAASVNLRRLLSPEGRKAFDDIRRRLAVQGARYDEASRSYAEVQAAYESARANYMRERAALGRSRVPPRFDEVLAQLESAHAGRDKAITAAHAAHRETLARLRTAITAHDEFTRKPLTAPRERRDAAWGDARGAFARAERATAELAASLDRWFDADTAFGLAVAALEATRGVPQVHRLEARARDMLRTSARLNLASILTEEAALALAGTIGEVKLLR